MGPKDASLEPSSWSGLHDLYWVDPGNWEDRRSMVPTRSRALQARRHPRGRRHSAKPGSGSSAATPLHRIDEAFMRKDFESHGFKVIAKSNVLRKPGDKLDKISYQEPMLGKTDRFVYVFRKEGGEH
jgi:hypothetical protein